MFFALLAGVRVSAQPPPQTPLLPYHFLPSWIIFLPTFGSHGRLPHLQTRGLKMKSQDLDSFGRRLFALPLLAITASLKGSSAEDVLHEHNSACHKNTEEKLALPCVPDFHQDKEGSPHPNHPKLPSAAPARDTHSPPTNIPLEGAPGSSLPPEGLETSCSAGCVFWVRKSSILFFFILKLKFLFWGSRLGELGDGGCPNSPLVK